MSNYNRIDASNNSFKVPCLNAQVLRAKSDLKAFDESVQERIKAIQQLPPFRKPWKTTLCHSVTSWYVTPCSYGKRCAFAHELTTFVACRILKNPFYKTFPCAFSKCTHKVCDDLTTAGELCRLPVFKDGAFQGLIWAIYDPESREQCAAREQYRAYSSQSNTPAPSPSPSPGTTAGPASSPSIEESASEEEREHPAFACYQFLFKDEDEQLLFSAVSAHQND